MNVDKLREYFEVNEFYHEHLLKSIFSAFIRILRRDYPSFFIDNFIKKYGGFVNVLDYYGFFRNAHRLTDRYYLEEEGILITFHSLNDGNKLYYLDINTPLKIGNTLNIRIFDATPLIHDTPDVEGISEKMDVMVFDRDHLIDFYIEFTNGSLEREDILKVIPKNPKDIHNFLRIGSWEGLRAVSTDLYEEYKNYFLRYYYYFLTTDVYILYAHYKFIVHYLIPEFEFFGTDFSGINWYTPPSKLGEKGEGYVKKLLLDAMFDFLELNLEVPAFLVDIKPYEFERMLVKFFEYMDSSESIDFYKIMDHFGNFIIENINNIEINEDGQRRSVNENTLKKFCGNYRINFTKLGLKRYPLFIFVFLYLMFLDKKKYYNFISRYIVHNLNFRTYLKIISYINNTSSKGAKDYKKRIIEEISRKMFLYDLIKFEIKGRSTGFKPIERWGKQFGYIKPWLLYPPFGIIKEENNFFEILIDLDPDPVTLTEMYNISDNIIENFDVFKLYIREETPEMGENNFNGIINIFRNIKNELESGTTVNVEFDYNYEIETYHPLSDSNNTYRIDAEKLDTD